MEMHEQTPEDVNCHDNDPYNRIGMTQWNEGTAAFRNHRNAQRTARRKQGGCQRRIGRSMPITTFRYTRCGPRMGSCRLRLIAAKCATSEFRMASSCHRVAI